MAIFKYTVANKEGKKLSGTVEAPDENIARTELNNLGFSILLLQETKEAPKVNPNLTKFVFEALDKNQKIIKGTIPAKTEEEARQKLKTQYKVKIKTIWRENASEAEIYEAKQRAHIINNKPQIQENTVEKDTNHIDKSQQKENFTRVKIEETLKQAKEILAKFEEYIEESQKKEINEKISKLLRIRNSKNIEYIITNAKELAKLIESQDSQLKKTATEEIKFKLKREAQNLYDNISTNEKQKSLTEGIVKKIQKWEEDKIHTNKTDNALFTIVEGIKHAIETPKEIEEEQAIISNYNKDLFKLIKLYFTEPTAEYKNRVKENIKKIWQLRKQAKNRLKETKEKIKEEKELNTADSNLSIAFLEEFNTLTGWLLTIYMTYYILAMYINTKDFGLTEIPKLFTLYNNQIFTYLIIIIFLLHSAISIKRNLFEESFLASIIISTAFILSSSIVILNF